MTYRFIMERFRREWGRVREFIYCSKTLPFRIILKCGIWFLWITLSFIIVSYLIINIETRAYIYRDVDAVPVAQSAVILGAGILRSGNLSPVLTDRTNGAIALYRAGKVRKILVTGDNGSVAYNEVNPVRRYLLVQGVASEDIFLDHAGFDTYSSMYRARDIFLTDSIVIVTQSFHLPRAIYIARHLGLNAIGFNADKGWYRLRNYNREILADVKAVADLISRRVPKFLGEQIPITGEAQKL